MAESGRKRGLLTIDDGPSVLTPALVDFLRIEGIPAVMFFQGSHLEARPDAALLALEAGMVIGNHSYSHPGFSGLTSEQAADEVARTEELIDGLHQRAGVKRTLRLFRFPFLDKGGPHREEWAALLARWGFDTLDTSGVTYPWFGPLATDRDVPCTFDFRDYQISHSGFDATWDDLLAHLDETHPAQGGSLVEGFSDEIVLLHDHPHTEAVQPGYYRDLIRGALERGVEFVAPAIRS